MKNQSKPDNRPQYKKELAFVGSFLKKLLDNISGFQIPDKRLVESYFCFRKEEGFILLDRRKLKDYQDVLIWVMREFSQEKNLSESAVDSALKTAIFEYLDIPRLRDSNPDIRLDNALEKLWNFLNHQPEEYECYIAVGGLDAASLPSGFGNVRFVVFNAYQLGKIKKPFRSKRSYDHSDHLEVIEISLKPLLNHPVAVVKVSARDDKAAKTLGERKVRSVIECLNFFLDIMPNHYKHAELFLPTESRSNSIKGFTVSGNGSVRVFDSFMHAGGVPAGKFSIAQFRQSEDQTIRLAVKSIELLLKESGNEVGELMLRAVRWAGRATAEDMPEESFLLFVIALECLVLPHGDQRLRHQLSLRVARLLNGNTVRRKELTKTAKELYDIRSKIVHSGFHEVTEKQCSQIRNIAKIIILKLLANQHVRKFSKTEDLEEWFEEISNADKQDGLG